MTWTSYVPELPKAAACEKCETPFSEVSTASSSLSNELAADELELGPSAEPCSESCEPIEENSAGVGGVIQEPPEQPLTKTMTTGAETLIYLDIDGVLNVGIADGSNNPIALDGESVQAAAKIKKLPPALQQECARRVINVCSHVAAGDDKTYAEICKASLDLVDIFVKRLADIIKAAGSMCTVVLSSSWRRPQYKSKLATLEKALSQHLGAPFAFSDKTALGESSRPEGRLCGLADHIAEHCMRLPKESRFLRILVLEDFHTNALGSWSCEGNDISSVRDVESFLTKHVPSHVTASVKLIHTYDEWKTRGMLVQIGTGLTRNHFDDAMQFLDSEVSSETA